jgi:hypothetical protein
MKKKHIVLVEPKYRTRFPPLGLLKISAYHKKRGDTTELLRWSRGDKFPKSSPDLIYVTSLYTWAWREVHRTVKYYKSWFPDVPVWLGGLYPSLKSKDAELSGADHIHEGLFEEVEDLLPDYDLVPEWDGSIVFSSRGCTHRCPYCAVWRLEGDISFVKYSIKKLIWPGHEKKPGCCNKRHHTRVIFFDNNILASPGWKSVFEEILELKLKVDFNQGLDARLVTDEVADLISRMRLDSFVRLAYDYSRMRPYVGKAIERLRSHGVRGRNIMVYALFNFRDSPEDFLERVRDILHWGAVCYPMRYVPNYASEKNGYIGPKWDRKRLDMVQKARRVIGGRRGVSTGAFTPFTGLIDKFDKATDFDEAFVLRPPGRSR